MPTTLFVLVNAVINAFRLRRSRRRDDARRTRQRDRRCCSTTSTRSASGSGTPRTPARSRWCSWRCLRRPRSRNSGSSSARSTTNDPRLRRHAASRGRSKRRAPGCSGSCGYLPLAYAVWTAFHPAEFATRFVLTAPLTLENFAKAWEAAPFARATSSTPCCSSRWCSRAQLVLVTLAAYAFARFEFPGRNVALRAGARPADGDAGRPDRRELPDDDGARA